MKSVSLLMGSGFSVPAGYPTGVALNKLLLDCNGDDFAFSTSGTLVTSSDGKKPNLGSNSHSRAFDLYQKLKRHFYDTNGYFDYEKFYDFITDTHLENLPQSFQDDFKNTSVADCKKIMAQHIIYYLKDEAGRTSYESALYTDYLPGYGGILSCLRTLSQTYEAVNVHTLNHDLFFERLGLTSYGIEISDGFEELGSTYYGTYDEFGLTPKIRLPRYTGKYDKQYRLYKLHGSLNYAPFYRVDAGLGTPECYVKFWRGIDVGTLFQERSNDTGALFYQKCFLNYHADFLSGTTSKIARYSEPLLYARLFDHFKNNLAEADRLLVIGYGAKDERVNELLIEKFSSGGKPVHIIDPCPGDDVRQLATSLNGTVIEKTLEAVSLSDLELA